MAAITDIFYMGDDIVYILLFLILLILVGVSLSRVGVLRDAYGRPNKPAVIGISLCVSLLATYWIYTSGYDVTDLFSWFGFSLDSLYPIFLIAILVIAVLIIWWLRFSGFLIIAGILLTGITLFTDMIYEKTVALVIGIAMFVIGFWLARRRRRRNATGWAPGRLVQGRRRWRWPFESV